MDRQSAGWTDSQQGWTDRQQDGQTVSRIDRQSAGWTDRRIKRQDNGEIGVSGQEGASEYRKVDKQARAAVSEASEKRIVIIKQI
jgi:hypothetical protein